MRFSAKLGESTEISHIHPAPHIYSLSYYQNPHQHNTFVITGEHTLTHHNHLKSIVYTIHSWYCTFCGFDKMYNDMSIIIDRVCRPTNQSSMLCLFTLHLLPQTLGTTDLIIKIPYIVLLFPECYKVGVI